MKYEKSKGMSGSGLDGVDIKIDSLRFIILLITFIAPVIVLPFVVDNMFNTPKNLVMFSGVLIMTGIYLYRLFMGDSILVYSNPTMFLFLLLIALNLFSFIYTENYYFTIKAALLNITCLLIFFFISLNTNGKLPFLLISLSAFSGLLVAVITWFQFFEHDILIKGIQPGTMITGTIGNSNFLGAYLVFPLFAMTGLIFLLKGRYRIVPLTFLFFTLIAFIFSRARAGWFGFFLALPLFFFLVKTIHSFSIRDYLRQNLKKTVLVCSILMLVFIILGFMAPDRFSNLMVFKNVTDPRTLMLRMEKYIPPSIWLIKEAPVFGTGLWSYRSMVYKAQAEINRVNPQYFEDYPSPKPRRVHNEYLEILNDGGLVAAISLLLFLSVIMMHGWRIMWNDKVFIEDRIITTIGFCSIVAIMLTSIFFFSFRLNTTMLMTVLMLGLMEGIYLRNYQQVRRVKIDIPGIGPVVLLLILIFLTGILWFGGIRPFRAEMEHFKYKTSIARNDVKSAEEHILKSLKLDPRNSAYLLYAAQFYFNIKRDFIRSAEYIERSITDFNGDITLYSAYFFKGLIKYNMGSLFEAKESFEKALYYNPAFKEANDMLMEVGKVIKEHDSVTIKLR